MSTTYAYTGRHFSEADIMTPKNRGPWSETEDAHLMRLIQTRGPSNWVSIAQILGSRTPKQCRERYHQNLKPTINHDPITPEEGMQIERLVEKLGKRWAEIARRLNGRSDNAVKNWWNGSQNRRKRSECRRAIPRLSTQAYGGISSGQPCPTERHHLLSWPGDSLACGLEPSQYIPPQPLPQLLTAPPSPVWHGKGKDSRMSVSALLG